MADLLPVIEVMETRWMRAWVQRDPRELRALTTRDFVFLVGAKPSVMLDARSWLDGATTRFLCQSFRFGDVYVRRVGALAMFATQLDLKATMDGNDWSGPVWVTDLWRKGRVRRGWRMAARVMSKVDERSDVPAAVRALQLWR